MQRFSSVPALQSKLQAMFHCKDYFCFELLGSGQFSDVYKGCHKVAGKLVAVYVYWLQALLVVINAELSLQ